MSVTALQVKQSSGEIIEQVIIQGDLAKLQPIERVTYYKKVCESMGLNPYSKPFEYIHLNGKLTLYCRKDATDQLRQKNRISIQIVSREKLEDLYIVTARATAPDGRIDEAIGVVSLAGQKGDQLANCLMKAETKSKRRVTLSICGLGWTDESELETIPNAKTVQVDEHGEIIEQAQQPKPTNNKRMEKLINRIKELIDQATNLGISEDDISACDPLSTFNSAEHTEQDLIDFGKNLASLIKAKQEKQEKQEKQSEVVEVVEPPIIEADERQQLLSKVYDLHLAIKEKDKKVEPLPKDVDQMNVQALTSLLSKLNAVWARVS